MCRLNRSVTKLCTIEYWYGKPIVTFTFPFLFSFSFLPFSLFSSLSFFSLNSSSGNEFSTGISSDSSASTKAVSFKLFSLSFSLLFFPFSSLISLFSSSPAFLACNIFSGQLTMVMFFSSFPNHVPYSL